MSAAGDARTDGFTLIEVLVILAVLALAAGVGFPALERMGRWQAFSSAATRVEQMLRGARADAMRSGGMERVEMTADRRAIGAAAKEPLPEGVAVTLPRGGVSFYADGSASGGEVALRDGRRLRRWRIGAATGAIERVP